MRISRKKRPDKPLIPRFRVNTGIRETEVRVINSEGGNVGVMKIEEAVKLAQEQELDLVEINPKAQPPVVQILDFTHFKYQKEKEARKQKANSHVSEMKGIRLSMRIGEHDMSIRKGQAEKFLDRGDKVRVEIILRDRERSHPELAYKVIREFFDMLKVERTVQYEQEPTRQGTKITAIIIKT